MPAAGSPAIPAATHRPAGKYLTFFLADEEYGIEILKVQEIIGMMDMTPVPRTPPFIRGVINLRGKVIPIVDLRLKFMLPPAEATEQTCIIVVQAQGLEMGLVVDRVSEVLPIEAADISEPPSFGTEMDTGYLLGIARGTDRVRLLLDIDYVLTTHEVARLPRAALDDLDAGEQIRKEATA